MFFLAAFHLVTTRWVATHPNTMRKSSHWAFRSMTIRATSRAKRNKSDAATDRVVTAKTTSDRESNMAAYLNILANLDSKRAAGHVRRGSMRLHISHGVKTGSPSIPKPQATALSAMATGHGQRSRKSLGIRVMLRIGDAHR
jgi:hypothetical protein